MAVRAKFYVYKREEYSNADGDVQVTLMPVQAKEGEDSIFGKYTPSGEIRMYIKNPAAAEQLTLGQKFYVDFTPAE